MDYDEKSTWGGMGLGVFVGIFLGIFFFGNSKYEGYTAEEWFNEYDYTISCLQEIEDTASYALGDDFDSMFSALDDINLKARDCY